MPKIVMKQIDPLDLIDALKKPCPMCGKYPTDDNSWFGSIGDLGVGVYCKDPCYLKALEDEMPRL